MKSGQRNDGHEKRNCAVGIAWGCVAFCVLAILTACNSIPAYADANNVIAPTRHFPVPDPLFEELLSDEPRTIPGRAAFLWAFMFENRNPPMTKPRLPALQFGVPYSHDEIARTFAELGIALFLSSPGTSNWAPVMDEVRVRHGLRGVLDCNVVSGDAVTTPKIPKGMHRNRKIFMDPANLKAYLDDIPSRIKRVPGWWWAVTIGDEPVAYSKGGFFEFLKYRDEVDYPYLDEALAEIKNKYGFGKFGAPSSLKAANEPFRWIAFNRWLNAKFTEAQKGLYQETKKVDPLLYVIGEDSVSHTRSYGYSRYGEWVDVATGQQRSGQHRFRQYLAYKAKLIRDLTGKDTWLVPHIERFPGSFTAEEVNQFLSELVRAGGTGFQLWPGDHVGWMGKTNCAGWDGLGAPGRWQTILSAVSHLRHMPKLKFPEAEAAIFFSNDSCCSRDRAVYFEQYEGAFTFLGPFARAWFHFVSDFQLLDGKKKLADYKVVVIPFATYQRKEIPPKLLDYVKGGGTVLCTDPQVFRYHLNGTETPEFARELFGITLVSPRKWPDEVILSADSIWPGIQDGHRMPIIRPRLAGGDSEGAELKTAPGSAFVFKVNLFPGVRILARFPDGEPAIVMKEHGSGRAIYFAFNPFYRDYFMGPHDTDHVFFKKGKKEVADLADGWLFKHDRLGLGEREGWHEESFDRSAWGPGAVGTTWEDGAARSRIGRRIAMDLTADWLFGVDPQKQGEPEGWFRQGFDRSGWMSISAGRNWQDFKKGYYGTAWYAKETEAPAELKGKALELFLPGVDEDCTVYVNEKRVFSRRASRPGELWDRPIRFQVSDVLRFGEKNLLVVKVHKESHQTGIYKPVYLMERAGDDPDENHDFGKRYSGLAWYANRFKLAADDVDGRSIYVHFQGVRNDALVYVNGRLCGRYWGWNQPFGVDVTDAAREGDNLLMVRVKNERRGGGIAKQVRIFTVPRGEPAVDPNTGAPAWRPLMTDLFQGLGLTTGRDIWRFTFPMPDLKRPDINDRCLTGNYFRWENFQVLSDGLNEKVKGCSYSFSTPPDSIGESCGKDAEISFEKGDLTDRLSAPWAGTMSFGGKADYKDFVVRWKTLDPVDIAFDLGRTRRVNRLRIVYTSEMPDLGVSVSDDGETYTQVAWEPSRGVTYAVPMLQISFKPRVARYVRLSFARRASDPLYLSEVDIWGE